MSDRTFLSNQQPLRSRLILVMKEQDKSLMEISRGIGCTRDTMMKFINGRDTTWRVLSKIEKYCVLNEGCGDKNDNI